MTAEQLRTHLLSKHTAADFRMEPDSLKLAGKAVVWQVYAKKGNRTFRVTVQYEEGEHCGVWFTNITDRAAPYNRFALTVHVKLVAARVKQLIEQIQSFD